MKEDRFIAVAAAEMFQQQKIDPVDRQCRHSAAQKEHRERFLVFAPVPFDIFLLHFSRCGDQSFQRIRKPVIEVREEMKYFMKNRPDADAAADKFFPAAAAVNTCSRCAAVFA